MTIYRIIYTEIRQFPSSFFYQNLLTDAAEAQSLVPITLPPCNHTGGRPRKLSPVSFLDLSLSGDSAIGKSFINEGEVRLVERLLAALLPHIGSYSLAIITPYKAQVNKIKRAMREDRILVPLLHERSRCGTDIEVNSVDGFQGREKDVVIFSAVRSRRDSHHAGNWPHGGIGFVADERRLNVAITRAKRLLVVMGDAHTLSGDATWEAMISGVRDRGRLRRADAVKTEQNIWSLLCE